MTADDISDETIGIRPKTDDLAEIPPPRINKSGTKRKENRVNGPPFTVRSMLRFCWGLTLTLSGQKQQNELGCSFVNMITKEMDNPPDTVHLQFFENLVMILSGTLRTMAFARDEHIRELNRRRDELKQKGEFWDELSELTSFSHDSLPVKILSFLGIGSLSSLLSLWNTISNPGQPSNDTMNMSAALNNWVLVFIASGIIGLIAVTGFLKLFRSKRIKKEEEEISKDLTNYFKNRYKKNMTDYLFSFFLDIKELVNKYYPGYSEDILDYDDSFVKEIIRYDLLPSDDTLWPAPTGKGRVTGSAAASLT